MKKISDQEFAEFLTKRPLYAKIKAVENLTGYADAFLSHHDFANKPFKFLCPREDEVQTFKTEFGDTGSYLKLTAMLRNDEAQLPYTFNKQTRKLDLALHIHGKCQSCDQQIDFLLKVSSDKKWEDRKSGINIFIQKIGQFPSYEINLNSTIKKYLNSEDQGNYKKALACLSISYGIGAYSYLRRVIENEIKRIIKDISELEFDGVEFVKKAFETFQKDFQMSKLIDVINKHLPLSLKELGDNPIRLLYEQLSGGIHEYSDEECMKKAQNIDVLLNYVIKKINEEKYQLSDVKNAMLNLRKGL